MVCRELKNINNLGNIKDFFAKINILNRRGVMEIDTFVQTPIYFQDPLKKLSKLTLSFYGNDNKLYDFIGDIALAQDNSGNIYYSREIDEFTLLLYKLIEVYILLPGMSMVR